MAASGYDFPEQEKSDSEPVGENVCQAANCEPALSTTQKDVDQPALTTTTTTTTTTIIGNKKYDFDDDDEDEGDAVPSNEFCALHREGESDLIQATRLNHCDKIRQLVRSGEDCNALCKWEGTACVVRVEREGFRKQLQMIGYSALHVAVIHSTLKTLKCLLKLGVDVNVRDKLNRTPLQLASAVNRPKVARLLIKAGSEVNTQSLSGRCPLIEAVTNLGVELTAVLLKAGAEPDMTDIKGTTPLTATLSSVGGFNISGRNYDAAKTIVQNLIDAGCDVNKRNKAGATALMLASGMKITPLMPLLIAAGSDVNLADRSGCTAFSMAIEGTRNVTAVRELMKHGAATHLADNKGQTPLSKVLKYGAVGLLRLLLSADAVPHDYKTILSAPRIVQIRQFVPEFDTWLHHEFHEPRSLMRLGREAIRKCLSPRNLPRVKELGLPLTLNTFVLGATE